MINNKKKTILAAAFVVAIIALAGVGYAAFNAQYKGETTGTDANTYDIDYVIVKLDTASYSAAENLFVTYDEETTYVSSAYKTLFKWTGSSVIENKVFIEVPANSSTNTDSETFTLTVTADLGALKTNNYALQYRYDKVADMETTTTGWTQVEAAASGETTILTKEDIAHATTTEGSPSVTVYYRIVPIEPSGILEDYTEVTQSNLVKLQTEVVLPEFKYTMQSEEQIA